MERLDQVPPPGPRPPDGGDDWLSLGEASRLLGINPNTLRRWADRGQVASFTTPGGHRRFARAAITALLPAGRERRPQLADIGASADRMARAYRRAAAREGAAAPSWLAGLDLEERSLFRERGHRMVECLLAHLDAAGPGPAMANLHEAGGHAVEYGAQSARLGASLSEAVEAFLRFRSPFVDELAAMAGRRGLDTREATGLLVDAETAMDKLLLALIAGWQQA